MLIPYSAGHDLAGYAGAEYSSAGHAAGYAIAPWGAYPAFSAPSTSPAHAAASDRAMTALPLPVRVEAPSTTASKAQVAGSRRASSPVAAAVTADSSSAAAPPPAGGELDSSQYLTLDDPE
ncbi:hypothetical protein AMAG_18970 [Allomyces macrogynus ATCC 38327]|uniref:Uncharacterized protein n=1 Tax=Allomyces macrogynus (strain ATCC 38327) TaxID=578462 RepID=A0A0L0SLE6_ALLM3|nr:hypothetical protein AMAG_18970 [Allomyces macrogynus ATCC 38327]|eukprot:KNE63209.1 hypothetical protein AMAG_18970 [Allomyces macrogynus ATCC 38327]